MNTTVSEYFDKQKSPQKEICIKLRKIIFKIIPDVTEEMKWGVPAYNNGDYYIVALKDHVNMGFNVQGFTAEELKMFDTKGKTTRALEIHNLAEIDETKVVMLLQLVKSKSLKK